MKRLFIAAAATVTLLLGGCATTIRSDVTTFHQWPATIADKSYVFEAPAPQDDTLELRSYQGLLRGELARLGFTESADGTPGLRVGMRFMTTDVPVRVLEPSYPIHVSMSRYSTFGRAGWGRRHWGGWYSPFYDPFWYGPSYTETIQHFYKRELQIAIKQAADGKRLFDVTVHNTSREHSTPTIMPAMVQSAFTGFPGVSGTARRIDMQRTQ